MAVALRMFVVVSISVLSAAQPLAADEKAVSKALVSSSPEIERGGSGKEAAIRKQAVPDEEKPPVVPMPSFALERYSGEYVSEIYGAVKVEKKGDLLELTGASGKDRIELEHWDGNRFKASLKFLSAKKDAGFATFDTGPGGTVSGLTVDILGKDGRGAFRRPAAGVQDSGNKPGRNKVVIDGMKVTRGSAAAAEGGAAKKAPCEFDALCKEAVKANGVMRITYEQFQRLRASGDKYVLVDVLSADDYATGHIPGAISFPLKNMSIYNAANKIPLGSDVVVYCLDHNCPYSDEAARKLSGLGYRVLAYKGGLDEWQQKGQRLERN